MEKLRKPRRSTEDKKASKLPPIHSRRWSHSGYIVRNKIPISWKSPSTTSTTSLGQLHEKLEALPCHTFDKLPVSVCALPDLSVISEVSEKTDVNSIASSTRTVEKSYRIASGRAAGVQSFAKITQKFKTIAEKATDKKEKSVKHVVEDKSLNEGKPKKKVYKERHLSPVNEDDLHSTSLLLVATLGSDESVINDTVERLPEHVDCTTDNIVELLAREAFQNRFVCEVKERLRDSGINTDCKRTQDNNSETIENTPELTENKFVTCRKKNKRPSTSADESNTKVIKETPVNYVSSRKKPQACQSTGPAVINKTKEFEDDDDDFQIVQDFISQHCTQKSNETNKNAEFNIEILECVSNVIDNVCLEMDNLKTNIKRKPSLKLKFTPEKKKAVTPKSRKNKKIVKNNQKPMNKKVEISVEENKMSLENTEKKVTPPGRRRRKLFSPKAASDEIEQPQKYISETEDDETVLSVIKTNINNNQQKLKATSYKDIEKDRKQRVRQVRGKKLKYTYSTNSTNKKMDDLFDKVKETVINPEQILLVDKKSSGNGIAIYNYSSGSEDEDFKQKRIDVGKRISTTTIGSMESTISTRRGRVVKKVNYPEKKSDSSSGTSKVKSVKKQKKRQIKSVKNKKHTEKDMIDQTMRKAITEDLNNSLVQEKNEEKVVEILEPKIQPSPRMEPIPEVDLNLEVNTVIEKGKKKVQKKRKMIKSLPTKKQADMIFDAADIDGNKTDSPLPGLIIEKMPECQKHGNDSISAIMLNNWQKIIQEGDISITDQNASQNISSQDNNTCLNTNMEIENEIDALIICDDSSERKKERTHTSLKKDREENVEAKSDRSISTMGNSPITAHGDLDEEPPHTKTLRELIEPRQLELQDLNESDAAYYKKLVNEISRPTERHRESIDNDLQTTVQLENLHDTVLDTNPEANVKSTTSERDDKRFRSDDTAQWIPVKNFTFDSDESSCKVSEDLQIENNIGYSKDNKTSEKKELKIVMQRLSTDEISRWVTPRNSTVSEKSNDVIVVNAKKSTGEEIKKSFAVPNSGRKMDHDKVFDLVSLSESQLSKGSIKLCFKISRGRSENTKIRNSKKHQQSKERQTINISSKSPRKRKQSPESQHDDSKRARVPASCDSGPSISSVTEWFNKHGGSLDEEDLSLSLRDNVKNVMEKLDTTLAEIHQSTSRKLIRVFVNAQKNLDTADEERTNLLKDFVERSKQLNKGFMEELKRQACTTIREDSKQKRNMVHLLKEDLHSIIDKLDRQRIEGSSCKK